MNELDAYFSRIFARIAEVERAVNNQARRINNMFREAKVLDVYHDEGLADVEMFGEGSRSKKIPWFVQSGEIRDYVPPSSQQRVMVFNPTGEAGKGVIMPGGYSSSFPQPHAQPGEAYRTIGEAHDLMTGGIRRIKSGLIILDGNVVVTGRTQTNRGIHDKAGVFSERGVWPPRPLVVPPVM